MKHHHYLNLRRFAYALFAYGLSCFLFCNTSYADNYYNAQQLASLLKNTSAIQADFKQKIYNAKGNLIETTAGTMALQRPNKFRYDLTQPSSQVIVADGKNLWVYNKRLQQITVQPLRKNLGATPALLLSANADQLAFYFRITYQKGNFDLIAKSSNSMFQKIHLQFNGNRLKQMAMQDNLGQSGVLQFYDRYTLILN